MPQASRFTRNASLDASLVQASMAGGFDAFCAAAMAAGIQGGPGAAVARADWFKRQPGGYRSEVVALIVARERASAT